MVADLKVFEKKLSELRERALESIDKIYPSGVIKDTARMFYQSGLNEARAAFYLAIVTGDNNHAE